jgi:prepilin-type N-terminal cleavage/methylation domain-containing protein/prepilin-type processing-associated H-X9-DG protein
MHHKGFTVIELLLVTAIILTIAALMSPAMFSVRKKALVVACRSNLRQIDTLLGIYAVDFSDEYIPRTVEDVEAMMDDEKLRDPATGIPSLKGLAFEIYRPALKVLRCPADTGSYGQDYYPTARGQPCWEAFGQSQTVNVEMYEDFRTDELVPGYNPGGDGPMFGASGVKRGTPAEQLRSMVVSDMWPHWHNGIPIRGETKGYYINILFYDGHVAGKAFDSSLQARQFLNRNDVKRWWLPVEE